MFFRRKKNTESEQVSDSVLNKEEEAVSNDNFIEELFNEAEQLEESDIDKSIHCYETLLEKDKTHVKAQSHLLKLYNKKRQELVTSGNINEALEYLDKIDYVMKQSKDSARGL